jgi:hypothetical protein
MKGDQSIIISQLIVVCPIHNLKAEAQSSHYYHVGAYAKAPSYATAVC